jgi:hypothetical protein
MFTMLGQLLSLFAGTNSGFVDDEWHLCDLLISNALSYTE